MMTWGQISKERQAEINEDRLREWPKLKDEVVKLKEMNARLNALISVMIGYLSSEDLTAIMLEHMKEE